MQASELATLNELLDTALSIDAGAREAWLSGLAPEHAGLRELLRRLLRRADLGQLDNFLSALPKFGAAPQPTPDAQPGDLIGLYRLERPLGSGGMASVWAATRNDDLQRTVALKLPHLATVGAGLAERMARERNILARLEHPNIARLYDAGVTHGGRPYLALEFIEGEAIDVFCRSHSLDIRGRVALLVQVARAVAYAHAHLVVHRDLKPSNVLVDRDGQAHLVDFGIAAMLIASEDGGGQSLTRQLGPALTPNYASPEQLRGEPVSTGADVYALGVLAYELLTDRRPYAASGGDLLATMQAVLTLDPPAPSQAAGTSEARRQLRGDLDAIVLKAMHKNVRSRYATALEFAEDLARYLNAEPVRARRDGVAYRVTKFVQRNRLAAISIALIAGSLVAGVSGTLWEAGRALRGERQARAAQGQAERRFDDLRTLTHSLLFDYHDAIKDLPGATPVRARLVGDALRYLDRLARGSQGDMALERELAAAYERLGDIQGGSMFANLGDTPGALASQRKALALRAALAAALPGDPSALHDLALAHRRVGILLWETGDVRRARSEVQTAWALLTVAGKGAQRDERFELARTEDYTGRLLLEEGDSKGARKHFDASTRIWEGLLAAHPDAPELLRGLSTVHEQAGGAADFEGDFSGALADYHAALRLRERLAESAPLNSDYRRTVAVSWYNIGEVLVEQGKLRAALGAYQRCAAISRQLLAVDSANQEYRGDLAYAELRIGDVLFRLGNGRLASAAYRRSLALRTADVRQDPSNLWKRSSLIEVHAKLGRALRRDAPARAAAEADLARGLMAATQIEPQNAAILSFFAQTYADLGDLYRTLGGARQPARPITPGLADLMYRRAEDIWQGLESRNMLSSSDRKRRADVATIHAARPVQSATRPGRAR